jgi:group II intron reverse transcriptase/maturase
MKDTQTKPYLVAEQAVRKAYRRVKRNQGAEGIDQVSITDFEKNLEGNLYKIWNRMSSGSYFPPAVKQVEIPKERGQVRKLGIPTVADRVAQMVTKLYLEPIIEPKFHDNSYGYRPKRSALDAVRTAKKRCWGSPWVIDIDIKGFFDHLNHDLMMKALCFHTRNPWINLYVMRWLKAPIYTTEGSVEYKDEGSPQGSVISPLLANLFMHHAFDDWVRRNYSYIQFERYADDMVVHCKSRKQAEMILSVIKKRLKECHLELHPQKTKIVYCLNGQQKVNGAPICFDFLGFTFQPRCAQSRHGNLFVGYLPGISQKAQRRIHETIRSWKLTSSKLLWSLNDLANLINPCIRGWINYFGIGYKKPLRLILDDVNRALTRWARKRYKRFNRSLFKARQWLRAISEKDPNLFYMWHLNAKP